VSVPRIDRLDCCRTFEGYIDQAAARVHRKGVGILAGLEGLNDSIPAAVDDRRAVAMFVGDALCSSQADSFCGKSAV